MMMCGFFDLGMKCKGMRVRVGDEGHLGKDQVNVRCRQVLGGLKTRVFAKFRESPPVPDRV
jgi:hypothetical protein